MEPPIDPSASSDKPLSAKETKALFSSLIAQEKKLFLTADVMRFFRVSKSTLYRWRKLGLLPCIKISGTCYYSNTVLSNFIARKMHLSVQFQLAAWAKKEAMT